MKTTDVGDSLAHETYMRVALGEAQRALAAGEPPVGACLVANDEVVASAGNRVITDIDITAHAEMVAIRTACASQRRLDLAGSSLFVTLEPCAMCAAACYYAGIRTVVFGAPLERMMAVTGHEISGAAADAWGIEFVGRCLETECVALIEQWAPRRD